MGSYLAGICYEGTSSILPQLLDIPAMSSLAAEAERLPPRDETTSSFPPNTTNYGKRQSPPTSHLCEFC